MRALELAEAAVISPRKVAFHGKGCDQQGSAA